MLPPQSVCLRLLGAYSRKRNQCRANEWGRGPISCQRTDFWQLSGSPPLSLSLSPAIASLSSLPLLTGLNPPPIAHKTNTCMFAQSFTASLYTQLSSRFPHPSHPKGRSLWMLKTRSHITSSHARCSRHHVATFSHALNVLTCQHGPTDRATLNSQSRDAARSRPTHTSPTTRAECAELTNSR